MYNAASLTGRYSLLKRLSRRWSKRHHFHKTLFKLTVCCWNSSL